MESIQDIWNFVVEQVFPHWPGIMFIVVVSIVAQTLKTRVLTKDLARSVRVVFWLRRVFPIIILGLGAIVGAVWAGEASPGVATRTHKIFYFMGCSGVSIIGFNAFKQWVKKKYDIEIGLPSLEESDESSGMD